MQHIISVIIIIAAVAYAVWRIRQVIKNAGGRCYGCPIKDVCEKKKSDRQCTKSTKDIDSRTKRHS